MEKIQTTKQTTQVALEEQIFPSGYKPVLSFFETERGIKLIKDTFEKKLSEKLDLLRVSAPRFITTEKGLQDDLAGTQVPVGFKTKFHDRIEFVHSLAKWKRFSLGKYGFEKGKGLYTDMDAVRKDEDVSPIHSVYVDQWDWEKIITKEQRTTEYIKETVKKIYEALKETEQIVFKEFPEIKPTMPEKIIFIDSQELETRFPKLTPKEREHAIAKEHGAVFISRIGGVLESGEIHDARASDYDDWELNGDILVWDDVRESSLELSSMGIRVDKKSLLKQLRIAGLMERAELEYHKGIIEDTIPLTIGGGIGQSRICMFLLKKAHIGEVQSSVWPKETELEFKKRGIILL
jgi:aspartate--ammonia ligase